MYYYGSFHQKFKAASEMLKHTKATRYLNVFRVNNI